MQDPADYDRLSAALGLDGTTADITLSAVCQSCLGALSVDGAGISLMAGTLSPAETASSDDRARWLDDRQFVLDEGPVIDAFRDGEPTLETDIANTTRWPAFVPHALDRQVSGVFAFPISVGERRVGTLSLYRDEVVDLDDPAFPDAVIAAAIVADMSSGSLGIGAPARYEPHDGSDLRAVHQAAGMVSVQMGCSVADAMALLRARAFTTGLSTHDVAQRVVRRELRFDPDPDPDPDRGAGKGGPS